MPNPDPTRAAALANAVELTRSDVPIEAGSAADVLTVTLEIADGMVDWLQGKDSP